MRVEVRPFHADDIPDAARLLAARHRRHRAVEPLLPARFEDPRVAADELIAVWQSDDASGAVARHRGRTVGYLLGAPRPGAAWGPNVWVESAGIAVEDAEVARDLYAAAAKHWVDQGRVAHYVLLPAHDRDLVAAWFRLAFGHQHTHGLREVPTEPLPAPPHVTVRPPERSEIPVLAQIDLALPDHQRRSPVFSGAPPESLDDRLAEWAADFDDPAYTTLVAEIDGRVVGSATACALSLSSTHTGLARPDGAGFLGFAAVLPEARGTGAGRALGEAVLSWSIGEGHLAAATDWRETNLLSSRAWPRLGYRPSFVRLHRLVGH